jgi:hypothetical protein
MPTQQEVMVRIGMDAWNTYIDRTNKLLSGLTDEQLTQPVAPDRNSGIYLMGHLVAIHDAMLPLLGLGERLYPSLENIFVKSPDKSGLEKPATPLLRQYWKEVHAELTEQFSKLDTAEWFRKHTAVSEADFAGEPHRNRLNLLVNRTNHLAYHYGQLIFLKA